MSPPRLRLTRSTSNTSSSVETGSSSLALDSPPLPEMNSLRTAFTPLPRPDQLSPNSNVSISRPLHLDTNLLTPTRQLNPYAEHSPALSMKIKVPKRAYSVGGDPLERMQTPVFDKAQSAMMKKTPSSTGTVLAMSGLFVCGVVLCASGVLVLILEQETPFIIAACSFLGVGATMLLVCAILQWKNVKKLILDMNSHLTGMSTREQIWKTMFEMPSDLPQMSK